MTRTDQRLLSLNKAIAAEYAGELAPHIDEQGRLVVEVAEEKNEEKHV